MIHTTLFVVSGGPGAGKTTVLQELAKAGFPHYAEVARQIIQEQAQIGGSALPWKDRAAYAELMLQRSIAQYLSHAATPAPTFCDRGIPDTLCYARLVGLPDVAPVIQACELYRYAPAVFLAPPWEEIYSTDTERKQDFIEAERTFLLMRDVYRELGYETVELPKTTPEARARFVVTELMGRGVV